MYRYVIRRLIAGALTFMLISFAIFCLIRFVPGGPVDVFLAEHTFIDAEDKAEIEERLGLDGPAPIQYIEWIVKFLTGDFGHSLYSGRSVAGEIAYRGPVTFQVGLMALALTVMVSVPIGTIAAIYQDKWPDMLARSYAVLGQSIPNFFLATLILVIAGQYFGRIPTLNWVGPFENPIGNLKAVWLPVGVIGVFGSSGLIRLTRTQLLEVMGEDYVRTARSKGLGERHVILKHALRNAMLPVITYIGVLVPSFLGGSIVLEQLFRIPGIGQALITAILNHDYPMIQGFTLMFAILVIAVNLIVDLSYSMVDPRVRLR